MSRTAAVAALAMALTGPALAIESPPGRPGTVAYNAWLGRMFVQHYQGEPDAARRAAVADQIIAPDYIQHNPFVPPGRSGLDGYEASLFASFPDAKTELQDVIATSDKVVARYVFSGTLSGAAMMGAPARGQKVHVAIIDVWSVKSGKLREHWDQIDWTSYLAQLGVPGLPEPFYQVAGVQPPTGK